MISPDIINSIKEKADIVSVISNYIPVTKEGSNYKAICPFHDDTRPSLMINPVKKIFKCFVCGTGGNCFTFVQKYERISFIEAVRKVAKLCNISVPELDNYVAQAPKENAQVYKAVEDLTNFYQFALRQVDGESAREYLKVRNIDEDVINHFRIGYAPLDNTRAISTLRDKFKYDIKTLEQAGILSSSAEFKDRYYDRIIFPLDNVSGDIVGFSGRIYKDDDKGQAKYINSPETLIFHKSEILYNYKNAKETCRKDGYIYVLEGFMDVIALYRAGITSAVALMGTALTPQHIALFKQLNVEVRLCLDSDNAGQMATYRASVMLTKERVKYKIVKPITDGKDPDEYLNSNGKESLIRVLNDLDEPILYESEYLVKSGQLASLEMKEKFINSHLGTLTSYSELVQDEVIGKLAEILKINPLSITQYINKRRASVRPEVVKVEKVDNSLNFNKNETIEMVLLAYVSSIVDGSSLSQINHFRRLLLLETGLICGVASEFDKFKSFESSGTTFYLDLYRELIRYFENYYLTNNEEKLEFEDYQNIIDTIELANATQNDYEKIVLKNRMIKIIEIFKNCTRKNRDKQEFLNLLKEHEKFIKLTKSYKDILQGNGDYKKSLEEYQDTLSNLTKKKQEK